MATDAAPTADSALTPATYTPYKCPQIALDGRMCVRRDPHGTDHLYRHYGRAQLVVSYLHADGTGSAHLTVWHTRYASPRAVAAVLSNYARRHYPGAVRVSGGGSSSHDGLCSTTAVYSYLPAPTSHPSK